MPISGIQDQLLQVTVVGCGKLKDTKWMSKQSSYVCLDYGGQRVRTQSCKGGGTDPNFNQKFEFRLFEGRQFINLEVWINHSMYPNEMIGSGEIQLERVLTDGFDDKSWSLWGGSVRHGTRFVGEVHLILHYSEAKKPAKTQSPPPLAPQHQKWTPAHQVPIHAAHPQSSTTYDAPPLGYPSAPHYPLHHFPPPSPAHGRHHGISPPPPGYPPSSPYHSSQPSVYEYGPPPPQYTEYPPQQYSTHRPTQYPPPPQTPPYPPNPYGIYPPPPY